MLEIRCEAKKHAEVTENSIGELRRFCDSGFCKGRTNGVVEHVWNLEKIDEDGTIRPIETNRFKRPEVGRIIK